MRNILDIAKTGAVNIDVEAPKPEVSFVDTDNTRKKQALTVDTAQSLFLAQISMFPTIKVPAEVNDGTKKAIETHPLLLSNKRIFAMVHQMAPFEPIVYARQGDRSVMGMLSPNYDTHGEVRQSSIKVLPLLKPYPLIAKSGKQDFVPDAQMAVMLAGSAHGEGEGVGSHDVAPDKDFEHKLTFLGAVSLNKNTILDKYGRHAQHASRQTGSVSQGLTNGSLGNLFTPNGDATGGFTGYGTPMIFNPETTGAKDAIFLPKSFVENELAWGVHYADAARLNYGAALQVLHERHGETFVSDQIKRVTDNS